MYEKELTNHMGLSYVKDKRKPLFFSGLCSLIMAAVYGLYGVSWEPFLYGWVLCLAAGAAVMAVDFYGYRRRDENMLRMRREAAGRIYEFPRPRSLEERDYIELLERVWEEREDFQMAIRQERKETIDYFTLWMHQVKTPIAAMRLMLQEQDTGRSQKLQAELFKTEQYVDMALTYLKLGDSGTDYVFQKLSVEDVVRQAVRNYASLFVLKKIKLELGKLDCEVVSDEKWLVFVIGQLLSNALKYTREGSISIYMRAEKTLVVQDTGIGIATQDLPRIWEKGFTGYNGRRNVHATGIGLYLCRRILKGLSHNISIESQPGAGTKVIIDLNSG